MSRIQLRGGTAAEWTTVDPVLASREVGVETDTGQAKVGDGTTLWSALDYVGGVDLSGKADLVGGFVPDAQIPAGITRDSELTAYATTANPVFTGTVTIPDGALAIADTNGLQAALDALTVGQTVNTIAGTTYTLLASDAGKDLSFTSATAVTVTVPDSLFAAGQSLTWRQMGAGQVTFTAGAGVTLRARNGAMSGGQYAAGGITWHSASEALVSGDTAV